MYNGSVRNLLQCLPLILNSTLQIPVKRCKGLCCFRFLFCQDAPHFALVFGQYLVEFFTIKTCAGKHCRQLFAKLAAQSFAKLIEFNTSCAPVFVQRAGLAALANAEGFVPGLVERLRGCRDTLLPLLREIPGVQVATPRGGLYAFLRAPGSDDSLAFAKRLVHEAGLGIAPGAAFGAEGEGWLRWCFASREPARLGVGAERLAAFLRL